jgi:hypothetical protein
MIKAGTLVSDEWFHPVWELFVGRCRPGSARYPARRKSWDLGEAPK